MVVLSESIEGSSSSSTNDHKYDVFLSFRGVDTRYGFTDHLHKALLDANISTFLDDEEIETGGDLKPELESAIKASRASIIVLSKNYANSSWCLDELVLILEQRMTSNQIVIPIFYHVEPTHVRKQEDSYGDAMAVHQQKIGAESNANKRRQLAEKMDKWNEALTQVSDLKGEAIKDRPETEFIEKIIKDVYRRLRIYSRFSVPQLFGMEDSINSITSWLKDASSATGDILTILGMGGIGKTSLAKYVHGLHSHEFDTSSFIGDISRNCENFNGLLDLQKQLCDDIIKSSSIPVRDISVYTSMIENALARKKVFLVLDDIDSLKQLDSLLGSKGFHAGSKIIITTKNNWLTKSCALFKTEVKPKHANHSLKGLYETASWQLLCFHAFMSNYLKEGYEVVLKTLVKYCEGHPLALKLLGESLYNRDVAYWEGLIETLKKENGSPVNNVLRISFDSLPSENDKDLFKHIACFFVGKDRDETEAILKACNINTSVGFTNLIDRHLLSIGWNNKLKMHQLLQEMGRFIVHKESPNQPSKRSRLWCHEDSLEVLKRKMGTKNVIGLALDMRILEKDKLCGSFELKTDALSNMDNLMLLQLNFMKIEGTYNNFPEKLRWLCMHGFPLDSVPSKLPMDNLVSLDMSYSKIKSFDICYSYQQRVSHKWQKLIGSSSKDKSLLGSLKFLNLSFCDRLTKLGGFDRLPALERLIVRSCIGLLEVSDSIEQCVELVLIDLSNCNKLENLPRTIDMLNKVKTIVLDGCNIGKSQMLNSNKKISSSIRLEAIPNSLKFFEIYLPRSLVTLSLKNNNLSTESFPMDFSGLSMLKDLCLDYNPIKSLPSCVRSLPRLETLTMRTCEMLTSVEHPPHTLTQLVLSDDSLLQIVSFDPDMGPLDLAITLEPHASSFEVQGLVKVQPIEGVEEKVLHRLGWSKLFFPKKIGMGSEEFQIQMYYEFGIFSTFYGGKDMPIWVTHRSKGKSISFTIPASPKNLIGLNFCAQTHKLPNSWAHPIPLIVVSNITKKRTWMYRHLHARVSVPGEYLTFLSHWMFRMNEMEGGDHVTIFSKEHPYHTIEECGVSFVYDDEKMDEEEEDVLGYYKSWNHIIGGDLTGFQLTTGEYTLDKRCILLHSLGPFGETYGKGALYTELARFRALSQRNSHILGGGT